MNATELLTRLAAHGLFLSIAADGQSLAVTGRLMPDLREVIKLHKTELIRALAYKIIEYDRQSLYGQMPACFREWPGNRVEAIYRTEAELRDHVTRALAAKRRFESTTDLVSAALALGGEFVPEMSENEEIPF
jgi:hypothetical protein